MPMTLVRKVMGVIGKVVDVAFGIAGSMGALIESRTLEARGFLAFLLC
jgi:hypothetical protein